MKIHEHKIIKIKDLKLYKVLSNGEKMRCDLAKISSNSNKISPI